MGALLQLRGLLRRLRGRASAGDIAETYARYERSGHARRWRGATPGDALMLAERELWLLAALDRGIRGALIDVGCGDANLARAIERAHGRPHGYVGIDLLLSRIAIARTSTPWAALAVASADALPIRDGAADAVVASTLFSSLRKPEERAAVARDIVRTLKPGGRVVVYDLRYPSPANRAVRPVAVAELQRLFGGLRLVSARSLTLAPPLARSPLGGGARRYTALTRIPMLRSHLGVVLEKPSL